MKKDYLKGRGAQINTNNRFSDFIIDEDPKHLLEEDEDQFKTAFIEVYPKSIVNKVDSPDIPMDYSINPYQGCEHGCVYCYARNSHTYWGYSAGLEFEQKILTKNSAPELLAKKLKSPRWKAKPIMLSGNTDCYQGIEKKLEITRKMLKVFLRYKHPVGIITKNSLVLRDLDILKELNKDNLVRVAISITTLDDKLRQFMEPRTSSIKKRLETVKTLSDAGIPVTVMMAPVIPGMNEHEILKMAETVANLGAKRIGYTMVRLNGDVALIFADWILKTYPDRAEKVMKKIKEAHGGQYQDSRFGTRMRGEGNIAQIIRDQFRLAQKLYFNAPFDHEYNLDLHQSYKDDQLSLF